MKKCIRMTMMLFMAVFLFAGCSGGDDNVGSDTLIVNTGGEKTHVEYSDGEKTPVEYPDGEKPKDESTEAEKTVDLSTTTSLSLKQKEYKLTCAVPDENGEEWAAELLFDDEIDTAGKVTSVVFASLEDVNGKGAGNLTLCVINIKDGKQHKGKLVVTYAGGKKIVVNLTREGTTSDSGASTQTGLGEAYKNRMIGYGYNAFKGYASSKCFPEFTNPVFRIEAMESENGINGKVKIVYSQSELETELREATGSSMSEISNNLKTKAKAGGKFCGFSAEASASFSDESKKNDNSQFAWLDTLMTTFTASITGTQDELSSKAVLTQDAYTALNDADGNWADFKKVVDNYGTHVVMSGRLGGKLHMQMTANTEKISGSYDVSAMIKAGYEGAFGNASAEVDEDFKNTFGSSKGAFEFSTTVYGGTSATKNDVNDMLVAMNPMTKTAATDPAPAVKTEKISAWMKTLSDKDNCVLMDFDKEESLLPIYELVDKTRLGGQKRYDDFKNYFEEQMLTDFQMAEEDYNLSTPGKVTIPVWDVENGSLIKDVYLGDSRVARITNEFIPKLSCLERVTVIYPANNTKVYYNLGYFIGDSQKRPCGVSWKDDGTYLVTEHSQEDVGEKSELYIKGLNLSSQYPSYLKEGESPSETDARDAVLDAGTENGTYNLVKILGNVYIRTFWHGVNRPGETGDARYGSPNAGGQIQGTPQEFPETGVTYYPVESYHVDYDYAGGFCLNGWGVTEDETIKTLLKAMENNMPDGNMAKPFLTGGLLGLNLVATGYDVFFEGKTTHLGQTERDLTFVGLRTKDNNTDTKWSRLVINPSTGSAEYTADDATLQKIYNNCSVSHYFFPVLLSQPM